MPLSEHEQRALAELEAQLSADDPRFASVMVADPQRAQRRKRFALAAVGVIVGIGLVVLAVVLKQPWVGAPGFVVIVLSVAHAASKPPAQLHVVGGAGATPAASRSAKSTKKGFPRPSASKPGSNRSATTGDFMTRMEERWERRRRENQGW